MVDAEAALESAIVAIRKAEKAAEISPPSDAYTWAVIADTWANIAGHIRKLDTSSDGQ